MKINNRIAIVLLLSAVALASCSSRDDTRNSTEPALVGLSSPKELADAFSRACASNNLESLMSLFSQTGASSNDMVTVEVNCREILSSSVTNASISSLSFRERRLLRPSSGAQYLAHNLPMTHKLTYILIKPQGDTTERMRVIGKTPDGEYMFTQIVTKTR